MPAPSPRAAGLPFAPTDAIAGVSIALVLLPQSLAYAHLAGMPAYTGLYAAALPPIVAAIFASSPYLQTGPVAVTALLTLGALVPLAATESAEYVKLAALLALVVGATRLLLGVMRAGVIAYLMSQPVLMGFMPAAAILIGASQLPTLLGTSPPDRGVLGEAVWALAHPGTWEAAAVLLAVAAAALMLGGRRLHPLFPGVLLVVVLGIAFTKLADYGGATLGSIPEGFLPLSLDLPWSELPRLLVPGAVIALVGFAEPASIARTFAALERQPWNANREFVSQGAANVAAAVSGGFPVGGSFSRSALARMLGARTRWSGAFTGLVVLAVLPFAGVFSGLPLAILAAIVIVAVTGLVRFRPLLDLFRYSLPQFSIAATTFVLTLALAPHVERALVAGIALAIVVHLWRELRLEVHASGSGAVLELRPRGVLWFGTARSLEDRFVELLAAHPDARSLSIDLDGLGRIDLTGALALRTLLEDARRAGLEVTVEGGPPQARPLLGRVLPEVRRE